MFQRICNKWLQMLTENLKKEYLTDHIAKLISKIHKLFASKNERCGLYTKWKGFFASDLKV